LSGLNSEKDDVIIALLQWSQARARKEHILNKGTIVTIGREVGNNVVLKDGKISKEHATIIWENGRFVINDLDSTNGTFVNDERITGPVMLDNGDQIFIGKFIISYVDKSTPTDDIGSKVTQADGGDPSLLHQDNQMDEFKTKIFLLPEEDHQKLTPEKSEIKETALSNFQKSDKLIESEGTPPGKKVDHVEDFRMGESIGSLIETLARAQSVAEMFETSCQVTRQNLEILRDRLQTTSEKFEHIQQESLDSDFINAVDRLINNPNDVKLLIKLAEYAELIRRRLEGFSLAAETLREVADELEKVIIRIQPGNE